MTQGSSTIDDSRSPPASSTEGWRFPAALLPLLLFACSMPAWAHEYWLDPVGEHWLPGQQLQADVRNGQDFVGSTLPFLPQSFSRAGLISDTRRQSLDGRLGDYPAFQMPLQEAGLHLLLLETNRRELRYDDYSAFDTFLSYHGLQQIAERHRDRGLPRENIIEHYYRYCKSLILVDDQRATRDDVTTRPGQDPPESAPALAAQGQKLELIATGDPLQSNSLRLQLRYEGSPLPGRQVEMFHRDAEQTVTRSLADTDKQGFVEFTTEAAGDYLLNSVMLVDPEDDSAHWETHWASLTYRKN